MNEDDIDFGEVFEDCERVERRAKVPKSRACSIIEIHRAPGSKMNDVHNPMPAFQETRQVKQINLATQKRLATGKLSIDAICDLHGLSLSQAHDQCLRFIVQSVREKKRYVLIITGKGNQQHESLYARA